MMGTCTKRTARTLAVTATLLLALPACTPSAPPPQPESAGTIPLATAARYLDEFDELCTDEAATLWGVSFCGPMLLVDPATRAVVANRADEGGTLAPRGGLFVGELPPGVGIANTATRWSGRHWTMLIWWSLGDDEQSRLKLMAHEAFHRLQPELGLEAYGEINAHLDTADGRYLLQLEWNALERALSSEGDARRAALSDALTFRASRRARFPAAAERERPLEIFEGLAEYSGMRVADYSDAEVVEAVAAKRAAETGLVRSFAYVSGPLYGYLLDATGDDWRERVEADTDLAALLAELTGVAPAPLDETSTRAAIYDGPALLAAERERERARAERLAAWRASLIDGPVLIVDLTAVRSYTFDPRRVFPFDEGRTVYTTRGLIADWGELSVTDGAILEDDARGRGSVSLEGAAPDRLEGPGWSLELTDGWAIVAAERPGDFELRRVDGDVY